MTKGFLCLIFSFLSRKPILCVWMEVCTQGKRRAGIILTWGLPQQHCQHSSSRSSKLILLLSSDGKWKSGSQSNYCPDCLLCSLLGASPAIQSRPRRQSKSRQEQPLLFKPTQSIPTPANTFQTWEFLISHLEKRKLRRVSKSRACKSTAFGSDVPAAGMIGQGLVWDYPPLVVLFCFFSMGTLAKERFNRTISKRKSGNGGKQ